MLKLFLNDQSNRSNNIRLIGKYTIQNIRTNQNQMQKSFLLTLAIMLSTSVIVSIAKISGVQPESPNLSVINKYHGSEFPPSETNIEVRGKFISPCTALKTVKIREYNVMGSEFKEIAVNANGIFSYSLSINDPKQITFKAGALQIDFLATDKEKVYNLEINCGGQTGDTIIIKNSNENNAFVRLNYANKNLQNNLQKYAKSDLSLPANFAQVKNLFLDYQTKVGKIASDYPTSYCATAFCPSEILPNSSFSSIETLRKSFFNRSSLSNPAFYYTFLSSRIILSYINIRNRSNNSPEWINNAMLMTKKNQDCAKRLQQVCYDLFYFRREEQLLVAYQAWVKQHPDEMVNAVVKLQLKNLESIMAGSQFQEIQLKDPKGTLRKLSETVAASKLTLLIFYSPTCSHCQEEIPHIVPVWNKYKSKGLKIYSVGYDGTNSEWNSFIKQFATPEWTHVFETTDVANKPSIKYVVNITPALILIDQQGKIISRFDLLDDVMKDITKRLK